MIAAGPATTASGNSVIVLGAGIVGLCTALALRRRRFEVTLIDAGEPGAACSAGNAGMIQVGSALPLAGPGLLRKVPRMLMDPEGPLAIRCQHLPGLLPWARLFLRNATADAAARNETVMAGLLSGARRAFDTLVAGSAAHATIRDRGELYVVRSESAYRSFAAKIESCRRNGVAIEELDAGAIADLEPLLAPDYRHGVYVPGSAWVDSPQLLSSRIHDLFLAEGGVSERCRIVSGGRDGAGQPRLAAADGRVFAAERLVIAAGSESRDIAGWFGPRLPIEPQRGYHVTIPAGPEALSGPVIEGEMNIAVCPIGGVNRVAGTMQFAGAKAPPTWRRADILLPMARRMVPSLPDRLETRWFGDRPGTPDSIPILGTRKGDGRVWYACGHGMLGLTLSARTGLLVAAAMSGDTQAAAAMSGATPDRFPIN
jgi:D-amino-acid dehydrogenase